METESKFDLLLQKMEEGRSDLLSLKASVETWMPDVERRIEHLQTTVDKLQVKVEKMEGVKESEEDRGVPSGDSHRSSPSTGGSSDLIRRGRDEGGRREILDYKSDDTSGNSGVKVLVQWNQGKATEATWEDLEALRHQFPEALAWGQAKLQDGAIVMNPASQEVPDVLQEKPGEVGGRGARAKKASVRFRGPEWAS
ncbi:hypothetical protein GUJ93_ZPchr0011g27229 [Zizania palustris]|uniref:Chromo domain-containing protein n=1 Tax=Zizania palustris TaxID=103762 RepID=A0A8J6BN08_ZIZPA|nr:hypothetical protein GUJ93_ZPchr0011g27229 [Zizania palustris]